MNIIKKITISALLSLSALGLTASLPAFADAASDTVRYCTVCHDGITVNGAVIGGGAKLCAQRSTSEWITTIDRMNSKGCAVPAGSIAGIASYLAGLVSSTTTTTLPPIMCFTGDIGQYYYASTCPPGTTPQPTCVPAGSPTGCLSTTTTSTTTTTLGGTTVTCYNPTDKTFFNAIGSCPAGTYYSPGGPITCPSGWHLVILGNQVGCYLGTTTTSTLRFTCYNADGSSFLASGYCPIGSSYSPPPPCPGGVITPTADHGWVCTTTTTSTSSTTISSTTTTTLCNTYVNGTTQYKYSGSGSCHSFASDLVTGAHIVRDQKYCRQHMTHFNSSGNHVHAYPHPACM